MNAPIHDAPPGGSLELLTVGDVPALAAGAELLSSGGSGHREVVAMTAHLLRARTEDAPVPVVRADQLPAESLVVHVGLAGSTEIIRERLLDPAGLALAVRAVAEQLDAHVAAVGIAEIGGVNGLTPFLAAGELGLPVVDGDLIGRAFPRIGMTTLALAGDGAGPLAVVGPRDEVITVRAESLGTMERLLAATLSALGGDASVAMYPTSAGRLAEQGITASLSRCVALGRRLVRWDGTQIVDLLTDLGAQALFEGRVDEIRPALGTSPGSVTLTGIAHGPTARLDFVDEYLAVTVDGWTTAMTPAVIVALDSLLGRVVGVNELRRGKVLTLAVLPPLHNWPPGSAALVGPEAFGLQLDRVER